jgi:hypothetical protein
MVLYSIVGQHGIGCPLTCVSEDPARTITCLMQACPSGRVDHAEWSDERDLVQGLLNLLYGVKKHAMVI